VYTHICDEDKNVFFDTLRVISGCKCVLELSVEVSVSKDVDNDIFLIIGERRF
jgi:hypothetical protein